jgi:hypothetical protein
MGGKVFFHVCDRHDEEGILREGFQGGWGDIGFGVYFYGSRTSAKEYASQGGWDQRLTDLVLLVVSDPEIAKICEAELHPSWHREKYSDMYWREMNSDAEDAFWRPAHIVIEVA